MADATVYPKYFKFFKTKPPWLSIQVFGAKWALEESWRKFWQILPISICIWCKLGKNKLFARLKQNHNVLREKDICPKLFNGADLRFHAPYQAECYLPWPHEHWRTGNNKKLLRILILWNILAKAFLPVAILFLSIASTNCKMSVASCKQWQESLDCPNSGLRRLSLFQRKLELEDWCIVNNVKRKMYWDRSNLKRVSASESLLQALIILDPHHKQPKRLFSWRVTWQSDFCHLEETAN